MSIGAFYVRKSSMSAKSAHHKELRENKGEDGEGREKKKSEEKVRKGKVERVG